jgi:hypothetical protein
MRSNLKKVGLVSLAILVIGAGYFLFFSYGKKYSNQSIVSSNVNAVTSANNVISENDAVKAVENLPQVKEWKKLFSNSDGTSPKTGGKPVFAIDSTIDNSYFVHVYEDMPDHTATFGWYVVDKKTGKALEYENSPLFNKYGPCYGIPEGECRE